jgi:hypothetical protein
MSLALFLVSDTKRWDQLQTVTVYFVDFSSSQLNFFHRFAGKLVILGANIHALHFRAFLICFSSGYSVLILSSLLVVFPGNTLG